MARIFLQRMVEDIPNDRLPENWSDFDFASFSEEKTLWDYQQRALQNTVKLLWKFYEDFADHQPNEDLAVTEERKRLLWEWYQDNGVQGKDFSLVLSKLNHHIASLLRDHYQPKNDELPYENFINRMSFWMATGSGKTLVIVKLIEIFWHLIRRGEIPSNDILILTHRDDLVEQLKRHVEEFNYACGDFYITLRELREYAQAKRETTSPFREQEMRVFYYRSDNLSDEQKERIVDFRNYDSDGRWYVLLDEAHKGDKEESKRQHVYAILSRNGFLFNFSATFTDSRDITTTVFNFNLEHFIQDGYGKHITILKQELRAFRDQEDYTGEEKQKVVLKALMMVAYVCKVYETIRGEGNDLYHRPLMLVLVNSVNPEDADLQLFFRELERIGRGKVSDEVWRQAKAELLDELREYPQFMFEDERVRVDEETLQSLIPSDMLQWVFNSEGSGEIEVLIRPSERKEMAFKLKTADRPFALIKIGDISGWLREKLTSCEITERFENESYFARLNEDDSDITILMGSRTFYEGWDSNRPNVICYINIGMGEDAQKFILQSVGRGVRIEPVKNKRKRLLPLFNAGDVPKEMFNYLKDEVQSIETLSIFGTNRGTLQTVVEGLNQEREKTGEQQLSLFEVNPEARKEERRLLIPVYKEVERALAEVGQVAKFPIDQGEFKTVKGFVEATDDRVLLMLCETSPQRLKVLQKSLSQFDKFYRFNGQRHGNLQRLLCRVLKYLKVVPEEVDRLKELEEEIRHFHHIVVTLTDIKELQSKVEAVRNYPNRVQELKAQYGTMSFEEFTAKTQSLRSSEEFIHDGKRVTIKHIVQHYYMPIILRDRADYIHHVIKTPSEGRFIEKLEGYLTQSNNKFREFDWWLFSKLDESLDEVYLPYYDPKINRIAHFKPDFVFWLQKGQRYFIIFVDPKGTEHTDYEHKVDGYRGVFEENGMPKPFPYGKWEVIVHLFLHTDDIGKVPEGYRKFWFNTMDAMLDRLLSGDHSFSLGKGEGKAAAEGFCL